ncbi:MAG TPA: aminodeoxychorismate lyase [Gallionellaceae bacterium]|nr:aminodeoxychorismate lyase [Gallionellaceae bacterium]
MIINGLPGDSINASDRGLMYGDGVFRTLLIRQGKPLLWPQHYSKLQHDCHALGIVCPSIQLLGAELEQLVESRPDAIAKIVITRGPATRGYAPSVNPQVTRILSVSAVPEYPDSYATQGISVYICKLRLGHQPRLAGIKHLNRLENVLAAAEWNDEHIAEGILLDEDEHVIEGTRSNLFLVRDGKLYTPDLSKCGVAGLQRDRVIAYARQHRMVCKVAELQMDDLLSADEIFVVNSVIGLWPVRDIHRFSSKHFPVSLQIQDWLNNGFH